MSLDVYLYRKFKKLYEDGTIEDCEEEVYSANCTHNLNTMADKCGLYELLWRPEEIDITKANQLIEPLTVGLELLKSNPEYFKQFNPSNGWGSYDGFVRFVEKYLEACVENDDCYVMVWR